MTTEKLFSYGTLQLEEVQLASFGRKLKGHPDVLIGYHLHMLEITDAKVIELTGRTVHPILKYTGKKTDRVSGTVFDVTRKEIESADKYEVDDYKRVQVELESGVLAWVYVSV